MPVHDAQFTAPHTGIVYTPPHASDHACVTLLLDDAAIAPRPLPPCALDSETKACTFRPQKTLAAFFGKRAPAEGEGREKRLKVG